MALTSRDYNKDNKDKKKKKKKGASSFIASSKHNVRKIKVYFANEKVHQITGLFLVFGSVFMLIAFTSFFFTW